MSQLRRTVNIHEAKTHFSALVSDAAEGKEILIAKAGKPIARLVSLKRDKPPVRFGVLKGKMRVAKDFDAPLTGEELDLFEGES